MGWISRAGCEETFYDVVELWNCDKDFDKDFVIFIRDHEVRTYGQIFKLTNIYMDAHGWQNIKDHGPRKPLRTESNVRHELEAKEVKKMELVSVMIVAVLTT